jgi:hypothetical protein
MLGGIRMDDSSRGINIDIRGQTVEVGGFRDDGSIQQVTYVRVLTRANEM